MIQAMPGRHRGSRNNTQASVVVGHEITCPASVLQSHEK